MIDKSDTVGDAGIRGPGDPSRSRSCIGELGESGCPPVGGHFVERSSRKPRRVGIGQGRGRTLLLPLSFCWQSL